jgi:hypothetical protein
VSDAPDDDAEPEDRPAETVNLSDPKSVRRARDKQKREQQETDSFWRAVFADKIGRRVMWGLIRNDCHGFSPPFACGPNGFPQPEATWFQAGQYSLGQRLYQRWMKAVPEGLKLMHAENDPAFIVAKPQRRQPD